MSTPSPRRSGRNRVSTVIQIDGYTVLKDNNYVVKGHGYLFGENNNTAPTNTPAPVLQRATITPLTNPNFIKKARTVSSFEVGRLQHKDTIQERVADRSSARLLYLARHLQTLSPFLDSATIGKLRQHLGTLSQKEEPIAVADVSQDVVQPKMIQGNLRDYQLIGLKWMVQMDRLNLGMILGDEMGLGKTLQTIALLAHLKEEGRKGPSLVLCPLSVLYSWCTELTKWAPSLKILRFHSSCQNDRMAQRDLLIHDMMSYDVVVTTYEMAKQPQLRSLLWNRHYFQYLILDEGHKIKDASNQISQAVRAIHSENKLILTGTPLQNNLVELWSLLNFLYPDIFLSCEPFETAFDLITNTIQKERLNEAKQVLRLFMLRRLKVQVEKLLPPKIETKVLCPLSSTQVYWYKAMLLKDISLLVKATSTNSDSQAASVPGKAKVLNNLIMQLRKCCLHPYLFSGAEPPDVTLQELIGSSGKLAVLDMLLRSLYKKGHRTVLFSQFTSVLDILEDYCNLRGWTYGRFDGSTARASRNHLVTSFQNSDAAFIFLMSTRSGGMGLNLQVADTCILYDSDWNPQPDLQAMARVHRIGQTKTVHVYRLISSGTIEERMVERAEKKLYMDHMVNSTAQTSGSSGVDGGTQDFEVTNKDMVSALQFGCNAVFGDDADTRNILPTEADIEIITDRTRSGDHSAGMLKGGVASKTESFEAEKEFSSSTKLSGVDFKSIRDSLTKKRVERIGDIPYSLGGIADEWKQIQNKKRQSKSRLIMVDGTASGYGKASVPVLAANNYDLQNGEASVFSRELKSTQRGDYGVLKRKSKKSGVDFETQDFCQVCGDGGTLLCCPRCPVAMHASCAGVNAKQFLHCTHHRCNLCHKSTVSAGGLLFACESCPSAFCEDCRPAGVRILGDCPRFEELGFTTNRAVYIHCSDTCENVAKVEFGWKPESLKRAPTPPPLDTSSHFGTNVADEASNYPDEAATSSRRLRATRSVVSPSKNRMVSYARKVTVSFEADTPPSAKKQRGFDKDLVEDNTPAVINLNSPLVIEIIDVDEID